jgi:hypothetical protein
MKNTIYGVLLFVSSLIFNLAYAESGGSTGRITAMLWYEGHTGLLIKQEGMSDLGGCGRADYYILDDQHPYFEEMYSLILAAHISSQPLWIHLKDCVQGISRIQHVSSSK